MSSVTSKVHYEKALWSMANLPLCLEGEEISIYRVVISHNKEIGELQAQQEKENRVLAKINADLVRDLNYAREGKAKAEKKNLQMSETIRRLSEEIKELRNNSKFTKT